MTPDIINALFELVGGFFTWRNAYQLYKDKHVAGVYWPTSAFFTCWGIWNIYYYPSMDQMWSFYAGIFLAMGNVAWVSMAVKYLYKRGDAY